MATQKTEPISAGLIRVKSTLHGECFLATRLKYLDSDFGSARYRTTRFKVLEEVGERSRDLDPGFESCPLFYETLQFLPA